VSRVLLRGITASPGIAIGPAAILDRKEIQVPKHRIDPAQVPEEVERLRRGVEDSVRQLAELKRRLPAGGTGDEALIFDAHLLILRDEMLITEAIASIRQDSVNAEWAVWSTAEHLTEAFSKVDDAYLRERGKDVAFVADRLLRNLLGQNVNLEDILSTAAVVVAHDLSPADTVHMMNRPVLAFCTDVGTSTSHTAIMARALGIPAVVGLELVKEQAARGDIVIVDGNQGIAILRPSDEDLTHYRGRKRSFDELEQRRIARRHLPAVTRDGVEISVMGNIELPGEAAFAMDQGAAGIGLYRTEFLYIDRKNPPDEEEQYKVYKAVVRTVAPRTMTLRTFDLGGDKFASSFETPIELNPALGLRAVRLGLKEPLLFKAQLRAMLRAGVDGSIRIMFPLISGVGEFRQARALVLEAADELERRGIPYAREVKIGSMIELPSAVLTARQLAREADFFSIGTNDLIQYALAIDRVNEHVAYLYNPLHPAILAAIAQVVEAAAEAHIPVSMCGAMAEEPKYLYVLLGLGLRDISVAPSSIPTLKEAVRAVDIAAAREVVRQSLLLSTPAEIDALVSGVVAKDLADFIEKDRG